MTPEQKIALLNHVERFGPASTARNDSGDFFMNDVEFDLVPLKENSVDEEEMVDEIEES